MKLSREDRELALARLRTYLKEERGEEAGDLAAMLLLDFITEEVGLLFFNEGIAQAQNVLRRAGDLIDADLESMKELPPRRPRTPPAGEI